MTSFYLQLLVAIWRGSPIEEQFIKHSHRIPYLHLLTYSSTNAIFFLLVSRYYFLNLSYTSTIHPSFRIHITHVSTPRAFLTKKICLNSSSSSATIFLLVSTLCKILVAAALKALNLSQSLVFIPTSLLAHILFYNLTTLLPQRIQCSSPGVRGHGPSLL